MIISFNEISRQFLISPINEILRFRRVRRVASECTLSFYEIFFFGRT